ncbi:hypothetical protein HJFPF1_03589 [Paramyrothecium foliicola]|nr:hypothetical protein HJFPF1_03589 [Paramyrothecium foliicola]
MARLSSAPFMAIAHTTSQQTSAAELSQLLARLQQSVLHPTSDRERRIRTNEYERARLESNIEYARTLLTKLERDALDVKAPGRRSELQGSLNAHRELIDLLLDRINDFKQMAVEDDDSSEGEDLLSAIIPTPSESMDSKPSDELEEEFEAQHPQTSSAHEALGSARTPATEPESTIKSPVPEATQTTQVLRARGAAPSPSPSQSSGHTTARAALFANRRKPAVPQTSTATAEAILDQQRSEQDALSDSILKMAGALKASSQKFSTTLEADKEVLSQATDGMDKTERGMEAARGRMGTLRKMTEGKGWYGRMILYAWVYGMMVVLVLLVFVLPKLRF